MISLSQWADWPIWAGMTGAWIILAAYILDRLIGDPRWIPHPVIGMGKGISALERTIRKRVSSDQGLKRAGMLFRSSLRVVHWCLLGECYTSWDLFTQ